MIDIIVAGMRLILAGCMWVGWKLNGAAGLEMKSAGIGEIIVVILVSTGFFWGGGYFRVRCKVQGIPSVRLIFSNSLALLAYYTVVQKTRTPTKLSNDFNRYWPILIISCIEVFLSFSALTLLVGQQEGHPACKN